MEAGHDLLDTLGACRRVLLTGPVQPDGDSLGACLALQRILRAHNIVCDVTGDASYRYRSLPGIDGLLADDALDGYDAVVVLDGDRHRLPVGAQAAFEAARTKGIIDHHGSTRRDGYTHFWLDPTSGSTCEMLFALFQERGEPMDTEVAHCLYAGLIFDTGGFRYSNTRPSTHEMAAALLELGIDHASICLDILMDRRLQGLRAAGRVFADARDLAAGRLMVGAASLDLQQELGLVDGDLEGLVESLLHVQGVEVGILGIEIAPGQVKLSFRSRGQVDVAALAHRLHPSGGGHKKAAGVRLHLPLEEALAAATATAEHLLGQGPTPLRPRVLR